MPWSWDISRIACVCHQSSDICVAGVQGGAEVIRLARELNPRIRVLVRTAYLSEVAELEQAGASAAFSGEGEVALAMTVSMLRELGATPDQIDRERDRVRAEMFGGRSVEQAPPALLTAASGKDADEFATASDMHHEDSNSAIPATDQTDEAHR